MRKYIHGIIMATKYGLAYYLNDTDPMGRPIERLMEARPQRSDGLFPDRCIAINGVLVRPEYEAVLADWDAQQLADVRSSWPSSPGWREEYQQALRAREVRGS